MAALTFWTIYKNPRDYPGKWVLRGHDVTAGRVKAQPTCVVTDSLEAARARIPFGLIRLDRDACDDPAIYEVWM